ncbi:hypothetical protein HDU93_004565, partial [Gonapodya sp. JEL0774]
MVVVVFGYYFRHNLGDDLLEEALRRFLGPLAGGHIVFVNPDTMKVLPEDTSAVVFGGGDLMNDYFLVPFIKLLSGLQRTVPVVAIGIGLPYKSYATPDKFAIFDRAWLRCDSDAKHLNQKNISFVPDLVFSLSEELRGGRKTPLIDCKRTQVGVAVVLGPDDKNSVDDDLQLSSEIVVAARRAGITCDIQIASAHTRTVIDRARDFESLDYCIAMKFHAHVLSAIYGVPYLSLCDEIRKTECLNVELGLSDYQIDVGDDGAIPLDSFRTTFSGL